VLVRKLLQSKLSDIEMRGARQTDAYCVKLTTSQRKAIIRLARAFILGFGFPPLFG